MDDHVPMRFFGHLPALAFPTGVTSGHVLEGSIRPLTVDEWRVIDDAYPFQSERYEAIQPVFLEIEGCFPVDVISDFEAGSDGFTTRLVELHRAFTVVTAEQLPNPLFSMRCLMAGGKPEGEDTGGFVMRNLGDMERELVVFGNYYPPVVISDELLLEVELAFTHLDAASCTQVDDVVAVLVRTTRPGLSLLNQMFHLTISLDALLVAPEDYANKAATRAFARRLASCISGAEESPEQYEHMAEVMYRVRSDLVHGRAKDLDLASEDIRWLIPRSRAIAAYVARLASAWMANNDTDLGALRGVMDDAFLDVRTRASLHDAINPTSL